MVKAGYPRLFHSNLALICRLKSGAVGAIEHCADGGYLFYDFSTGLTTFIDSSESNPYESLSPEELMRHGYIVESSDRLPFSTVDNISVTG